MRIDASHIYYRELNEMVRRAIEHGHRHVVLENVCGQRYIGTGLPAPARLEIHGVPGNNLAAFMDGSEVIVYGNAQDGVGNTMNDGLVVVHGHAGDILGYSMRGGTVLVRDDVGYRCGIHMKAYKEKFPRIVVGGGSGDYLGEYMAGGLLLVLGRTRPDRSPVGEFVGTGMHGGAMFIRKPVEPHQVGKEVGMSDLTERDWQQIEPLIRRYCEEFGVEGNGYWPEQFVKLVPQTTRPYGRLYAY